MSVQSKLPPAPVLLPVVLVIRTGPACLRIVLEFVVGLYIPAWRMRGSSDLISQIPFVLAPGMACIYHIVDGYSDPLCPCTRRLRRLSLPPSLPLLHSRVGWLGRALTMDHSYVCDFNLFTPSSSAPNCGGSSQPNQCTVDDVEGGAHEDDGQPCMSRNSP